MSSRILRSLALVLCAFDAFAQAHLVKDIRPLGSPNGSAVQPMATAGNLSFFAATLPSSGIELWKTDGTSAGTQLVRDICPGVCSSLPEYVPFGIALGNRIAFVANDGVHGREMWASDGTESGTVMLADVNPGSGSGAPATFITIAGSLLYFDGVSPTSGRELWCSDGTPGGTHLVTDLNPGSSTSFPTALGSFGSRLLFRAFDGTTNGIYISDGTQSGTHFVNPLTPTRGMTFGSNVLMTVHETDQSWSLWKSDGTSAGTLLVKGGFKTAPDQMTVVGNAVYFTAADAISGTDIWRTDGTTGGTSLIIAGLSNIIWTRAFGSNLLFTINDGGVTGAQVWISDGTTTGTREIQELQDVELGVTVGQRHLFPARDAYHGWELWTTDGTTAGTQLVSDIYPGAGWGLTNALYLIPRPGGVFFPGDDGVHGAEPWVSDGSAAGTHLVKDVRPDTSLGSSPSLFGALDGKLLFTAIDGASFPSVWTSDGTATGTFSLATFLAPPVGAAAADHYYYFSVYGGAVPGDLWRSDGTSAGTIRLYHSDLLIWQVSNIVPLHGKAFFLATDAAHGGEPWISDGSVEGTHVLADLNPGDSTSYPSAPSSVGDYVYFQANERAYRTDGTESGTVPITNTLDAAQSRQPHAFTKAGGSVYFLSNYDNGLNLWRTDMTTTQAQFVSHLNIRIVPLAMWSAGGGVMFFGDGALWRSDGTSAGTVKVLDNAFSCNSVDEVTSGGGVLYWYRYPGTAPELWRSDGTIPGTFKLASLDSPDTSQTCSTHATLYADGHLYFIGSDAAHGDEPWISDGTVAGTRLLADVNPGAPSSNPGPFLKIGATLYFAASEPGAGRELWAITEPDCVAPCTLRRRAVRA
ncbi:MAG TPA: hypothetical protein VGR95_23530 [Thermoanaerobaculia bacterium]|jgi:ELWxxDGT repeat protein|nr:hypothetical protein [Thermoanaerobaculia bacterium]